MPYSNITIQERSFSIANPKPQAKPARTSALIMLNRINEVMRDPAPCTNNLSEIALFTDLTERFTRKLAIFMCHFTHSDDALLLL